MVDLDGSRVVSDYPVDVHYRLHVLDERDDSYRFGGEGADPILHDRGPIKLHVLDTRYRFSVVLVEPDELPSTRREGEDDLEDWNRPAVVEDRAHICAERDGLEGLCHDLSL